MGILKMVPPSEPSLLGLGLGLIIGATGATASSSDKFPWTFVLLGTIFIVIASAKNYKASRNGKK